MIMPCYQQDSNMGTCTEAPYNFGLYLVKSSLTAHRFHDQPIDAQVTCSTVQPGMLDAQVGRVAKTFYSYCRGQSQVKVEGNFNSCIIVRLSFHCLVLLYSIKSGFAIYNSVEVIKTNFKYSSMSHLILYPPPTESPDYGYFINKLNSRIKLSYFLNRFTLF